MKRSLTQLVMLLVGCTLLHGCGFSLRGSGGDRLTQRIYVQGNLEYTRLLHDALRTAGAQVVATRSEAEQVLRILGVRERLHTASISRIGTTAELELQLRVDYDLVKSDGSVLLPPRRIELRQEYFNDEINILGRDAEEELLRKELREQAVQRILRRLGKAAQKAASAS